MSVGRYHVVKDVILIILPLVNFLTQDMITCIVNKHRFPRFKRKILKKQLLNFTRIYLIHLYLSIEHHFVVKYKD